MDNTQGKILWIDDEIDLLQAYFIFLSEKGYEVVKSTNGLDAIDVINNENFDIVFLDENMPGLSGLDTLSKIKRLKPNLPVIMITKNEAENIMNLAIGKQISDYLTKPVNPSQILLTLKKHLHKNSIEKEHTTNEYSTEFQAINLEISNANSNEEFFEIYKKLTYWDLRLDETQNENMHNILMSQKEEANFAFSKYIIKNYENWFMAESNRPLISPDIFKRKFFHILTMEKRSF